jgi:Helix-turn-helix domain
MSVRVMTAVWSIDLPDSQKIVLLALADCANDEGLCWPSMATLTKKCSKGERTVQGVIKDLVTAGHLSRDEVAGRGCKYLVHPRSDCAPQKPHPRSRCATPPQPLRDTPAAAADKPSKNHQEPSNQCAADATPRLKPEHIVEEWNATAKRLGKPQVRNLTPERRQLLKARIAQYELDDFLNVFGKIERSPFLRGDTGWTRCTFDWIFKKANFQKALEGNYDN